MSNSCGSPTSNTATVTVNTPTLADLNCDCLVNAFDIQPFVWVVTGDLLRYYGTLPDCDHMLGDCNGDAVVDAFDIDPFVDLLVGG